MHDFWTLVRNIFKFGKLYIGERPYPIVIVRLAIGFRFFSQQHEFPGAGILTKSIWSNFYVLVQFMMTIDPGHDTTKHIKTSDN